MPISILKEIRKLRSDYIFNHHKLPTRLLIDERSYIQCKYDCSKYMSYINSGYTVLGLEIFIKEQSPGNYKKCIIVE